MGTIMPIIDAMPKSEGLPDLFRMNSGRRVKTMEDWSQRRDELKDAILKYEYGRIPPPVDVSAFRETAREVFSGVADEVNLVLAIGSSAPLKMRLTLIIPKGRGPFPVILINEREIMGTMTLPENTETAVRRGYIMAVYRCSDLQADETADLGPAKNAYPEYDWGTLAVWAWGGMRVIDYLVTLPEVDETRILVTGHSRGGKTALLTGALDERVAMTVPNASGGGGFQCWRFPIEPSDPPGVNRHESVALMSTYRTYWLHPGLKPFAETVARLPFDQHFLAALIAPRWLCTVECMDDDCGTPLCVQRTYLAAKSVYDWMGVPERVGLYFRQKGGHAQGPEDWGALLDFADINFFGKNPQRGITFNQLPYPDIR